MVLRCFIVDAPTRAIFVGHYGHNSRFPCSKSHVQGEIVRRGVAVLRGVDHRPRTSFEYNNRCDGEHHREGPSPLAPLGKNLVGQVPFEYMHLVLLDVFEKMLSCVIDGRFSKTTKLIPHQIKLLSFRLELVKSCCPKEFSRNPERIEKHKRYKAVEHRQILFYTGQAVFVSLLENHPYCPFMMLHNAMRILLNCALIESYADYAEGALKIFVEEAESFYGEEFLSYNVYGLLVDDVTRFGPLDSYSAFPYENNMTSYRKACRKNNQHLQQMGNRLIEAIKNKHNNSLCSTAIKEFSPH